MGHRDGWLRIAESASAMVFDSLRAESRAVGADAVGVREDGVEIDPNLGILRGPRTQRHASAASLERMHEGAMLQWSEAATGLTLMPTLCSYLYFDAEATLGLHQDVPACTFTAVVHLDGHPPELQIMLAEGDMAIGELVALSRSAAGHPDAGEVVALHADVPLIFRGSRYPHRLRPFAGSCTLATFCYAPVLAPVAE